jgi:hypothetical protein
MFKSCSGIAMDLISPEIGLPSLHNWYFEEAISSRVVCAPKIIGLPPISVTEAIEVTVSTL